MDPGRPKDPAARFERALITEPTADAQQLVNSYFERVASYWAETYRSGGVKELIHRERLHVVLGLVDMLGLPEQAQVLEIGCGTGPTAVSLAARNYLVQAMDSVEAMVNATRDRAVRAGVRNRMGVSRGDAGSLAFADRTFSLVVAIGVWPWLPAVERPLKEIYRVLQPGGYLIVTVDNRWSLFRFLDPLTNPWLRPLKRTGRRMLWRLGYRKPAVRSRLTSIRECDAMLAAAGFGRLKGLTLGFGPLSVLRRELLPYSAGLKVHHWLQRLANRGLPVFRSSGAHYIVLARKVGDA